MTDFNAIDITAITGPSYFQEYRDKSQTPWSRPPSLTIGVKLPTSNVAEVKKSTDETPLANRYLNSLKTKIDDDVDPSEVDPLFATKQSRIKLLMMKYEGTAQREDSIRLEMLTQRINRLEPRITENEIAKLDLATAIIENLSDDIDDILHQLELN